MTSEIPNGNGPLDIPIGACSVCSVNLDKVPTSEIGQQLRSTISQWRTLLKSSYAHKSLAGQPSTTLIATYLETYIIKQLSNFKLALKKTNPKFREIPRLNNTHVNDQDEHNNSLIYTLALKAGELADLLDKFQNEQFSRQGTLPNAKSYSLEDYSKSLLHETIHYLEVAKANHGLLKELEEASNPQSKGNEEI